MKHKNAEEAGQLYRSPDPFPRGYLGKGKYNPDPREWFNFC
ncbi:hypothetical protein V0288_06050 [Pannus brasiliensis CCIBt3594]|uniref:Uncharacterized protein n=1 Tax=Pannus brasiliensis CCIBt3594 TaxID=1427578 RepID=A0AAW9QR58_9CHRO